MKSSGNYVSHLFLNLQQLFHRHLFVLRDPAGAVHAAEAAAAAVLVEVDVIEFDLNEGGAQRRHGIMTLFKTLRSALQPEKIEGREKEGIRDEAERVPVRNNVQI